MNRVLRLFLVGLVWAAGFPALGQGTPADDFQPPDGLADGWYAGIETSKGRILAMLLPDQAPQTVAYFAALAEGWIEWTDPVTGTKTTDRYYDGVRVHRAEAGSLFEAGDQRTDGRIAPMLFVPPETGGPHTFHSGYMLGMTRYTSARISAVQFFITAASQPFMTGSHPCFGKVVEGQDVIFNISAVRTYSNGRPIDSVTIDKIRIFKVGDPAPLEEPQPYTPKRFEMQPVGEMGAKPDSP